jgi:1-acyl-sn-glycerol-3-phosphate acyltransferase
MTGGPDHAATGRPTGARPGGSGQGETGSLEETSGGLERAAAGPEEASGGPGEALGSPEVALGSPEVASGSPEAVSGSSEEASAGPHAAADRPQAAAGRPGAAGAGAAGRGRKSDRLYRLAAVVVKPLMRAWFRIRLEGHEHIPERGPVILASNHRSNMDPVLLAAAVERPVAFMAKAELFVEPLGWILRSIGQFPVRRGGIDREALRRTDAILARGAMLGLFPEGTRGDGTFAAVHPGLAYIVVRQRCPVVPVAIFGTERVRRRFGWLPFASPVRIVIGPPIDLPQSTSDRAGRRAASEVLRHRLQAFLATAGGMPGPLSSNT